MRSRRSRRDGTRVPVLGLGRHPGRLRPRRRRAARRDDRRPPLPRRPQRRAAPDDPAGLPGPQRRAAHGHARDARAAPRAPRARSSSTATSAACTTTSREQLDEVVDQERDGIDRRVQEAAASGDQRRQEIVEDLAAGARPGARAAPARPRRAVQSLQQYDFMDDAARQRVRRAHGRAARAADAELLQPDVRGHAEHVARADGAHEGHARRAQPDARAARARRGARLRRASWSATATSSPATRRPSTSCSSRWRSRWRRCSSCSTR